MSRIRFAPQKGDTCCVFVVRRDDRAVDGNVYCGRIADGPHPDPEISYRRPLCDEHAAAVKLNIHQGSEAASTKGGPT